MRTSPAARTSGILTSRSAVLCLGGLLLSLSMTTTARAHDKWLDVEPFVSQSPGRTKVYLLTGEQMQHEEMLPERRTSRLSRFEVRSTSGRRDLRTRLREDQQPIAVLEARDLPAGTSVLALDKSAMEIELGADKFQSYLLEERLIDILALRAARGQEDSPGRERYSRYLKAVMQVGQVGPVGQTRDDIVSTPVGQDLELVPQQNPYRLVPGATLTIQLLFLGKPLSGRAVTAVNRYRSNVVVRTLRTDAQGKASFVLGRVGEWMFATVHMQPSAEPDMDWRSYWASLSFQWPDGTPSATATK